jgi:para-aminobenzoate synthetase component 1
VLLHRNYTASVHFEDLDSPASVEAVLSGLLAEEGPAVLESSALHESYGRYSILACRPLEVIRLEGDEIFASDGTSLAKGSDAIWAALSRAFSCVRVAGIPSRGPLGLPARGEGVSPLRPEGILPSVASSSVASLLLFPPVAEAVAGEEEERGQDAHGTQGRDALATPMPYVPGWIGYLGYELGRHVERLPGAAARDTHFPDLRLAFYDVLAVYDALERRWRIVELAFDSSAAAPPLAGEAAAVLRRLVREAPAQAAQAAPASVESADPSVRPAESPLANFTPDAYRRAVARCVEYIAAGDIFQVNLSQRLTVPSAPPPQAIYRRLRRRNPAWYSAFLAFEHHGSPCAIVCSSPELFLRVRGREVLTRPIKGTRPRIGNAAADSAAAEELLASAKDNAELTMIVDLLRNDLGRVCEYGSIRVEETRRLETHPTVFHLVATVRGLLREGVDAAGLLRATFPGGSITGAPKIRAMEIIDELEGVARGVYTGCVGWVGVSGDSEWNIAIRTVVCDGNAAHVQVGGGIVADSDPQAEYQETLDKARALMEAIAAAR